MCTVERRVSDIAFAFHHGSRWHSRPVHRAVPGMILFVLSMCLVGLAAAEFISTILVVRRSVLGGYEQVRLQIVYTNTI
jgi:hypothetical protein